MSEHAHPAVEPHTDTAPPPRTAPRRVRGAAGGLQVEDRVTASEPARGLADEFRAAGFPGETATIDWHDVRGPRRHMDRLGRQHQRGAGRRPARSAPTSATPGRRSRGSPSTPAPPSVDVLTQTARSLATAANVVRAIDAVTAKPETGSTLTIVTTPLKQVATIQTNVPNVYLEQPAFNTVIENDLRLAINDGLDKLDPRHDRHRPGSRHPAPTRCSSRSARR